MNNRIMRVKHPKYGRGYVLVIAEDYFCVKFRTSKRRVFPINAFYDGTLQASEKTVKHFQARHNALLDWAASEKKCGNA